jgi:hypothetical protein
MMQIFLRIFNDWAKFGKGLHARSKGGQQASICVFAVNLVDCKAKTLFFHLVITFLCLANLNSI